MKFIAAAVIVFILVAGWLITLRMIRTANRKKTEWRNLRYRANLSEKTISKIENEITLALSIGSNLDVLILGALIKDYENTLESSNVKEIS